MTYGLKFCLGAVAGALIMCMASPATAQVGSGSSAPISGGADQVSFQKDKVTLSGQVDIRQGQDRLLCDTMYIYAKSNDSVDQAFRNADKVEAIGNFYYITPEQEIRGDRGVFLQAENTFTITGNVTLLQGDGNVVTGHNLVYNLTSEEAKMVGTCQGRRCGNKGRVRILIKNTGNGQSVGLFPRR